MRNVIILLTVLLFVSCAGTQTIVTETKEKVETLAVSSEIKLDTLIIIPEEKVCLFIPVEKIEFKNYESPKVFTQKKGRARVTATIDSLGLKIESNCDSIAQRIQFWKKEVKRLRLEVRDTNTKETKKRGYSLLQLILYMTATGVVCFAAAYILKTLRIL